MEEITKIDVLQKEVLAHFIMPLVKYFVKVK